MRYSAGSLQHRDIVCIVVQTIIPYKAVSRAILWFTADQRKALTLTQCRESQFGRV